MPSQGDAAWIVSELASRGDTLAVAESLTGGLLASRIVSVPGASKVFLGGVVSYDPAVKSHLLGVDPMELATLGAVSEGVAIQMATAVRKALVAHPEATWGVSTTGVAGPDPEPVGGQPPGLVIVSVVGPFGYVASEKLGLVGQARNHMRELTVDFALGLLQRALTGDEPSLSDPGAGLNL